MRRRPRHGFEGGFASWTRHIAAASPLTASGFAPNRANDASHDPAFCCDCCCSLALRLAGPAEAAFNVCNKTELADPGGAGPLRRHQLDQRRLVDDQRPQTCADLVTGPLQARYYYLYASDGAAGTWEGKTAFLRRARRPSFRAAGRGDCAKRGFDRRGFFEVDTGNKPDWTQTLSN